MTIWRWTSKQAINRNSVPVNSYVVYARQYLLLISCIVNGLHYDTLRRQISQCVRTSSREFQKCNLPPIRASNWKAIHNCEWNAFTNQYIEAGSHKELKLMEYFSSIRTWTCYSCCCWQHCEMPLTNLAKDVRSDHIVFIIGKLNTINYTFHITTTSIWAFWERRKRVIWILDWKTPTLFT